MKSKKMSAKRRRLEIYLVVDDVSIPTGVMMTSFVPETIHPSPCNIRPFGQADIDSYIKFLKIGRPKFLG